MPPSPPRRCPPGCRIPTRPFPSREGPCRSLWRPRLTRGPSRGPCRNPCRGPFRMTGSARQT
eukprot:8322519-Pyramimonas_sp.AAC.1